MRIGLYLLRRHAFLYGIYWAVMFAVLMIFMASFEVFGPWIHQAGRASAWTMTVEVAPQWFIFAMGVVAATVHLPIAIAHGVTRREFVLGAGVFALATVVLFQAMEILGLLVEVMVYESRGLMEQITEPYPWPTPRGILTDLAYGLGFMLSGWLIGLAFYRLKAWWALLLTPLALLPVTSGMGTAYTSWDVHWAFITAMLAASATAACLGARTFAVKPRKA
jgi:hypothetical protein